MSNQVMKKLYDRYKREMAEYAELEKKYQGRTKSEFDNAIMHLDYINTKNDILKKIRIKRELAWRIYRRIWSPEQNIDLCNKYLAIIDDLREYDEFHAEIDIVSFEVHSHFVRVFKEDIEGEKVGE